MLAKDYIRSFYFNSVLVEMAHIKKYIYVVTTEIDLKTLLAT